MEMLKIPGCKKDVGMKDQSVRQEKVKALLELPEVVVKCILMAKRHGNVLELKTLREGNF